jgi:putative ABC transport system permease protein
MFLSSLAFALRNIRRNKLLAAINVLGLSIGLTACLVIFLIASFELSYDRFHADGNRIFRIYSQFKGVYSGTNPGLATGVAQGINEHLSGIEVSTNFHTFTSKVKIPQQGAEPKVIESTRGLIMAGPEYFKIFDFYDWLIGNPEKSLTAPSGVVLTESRARTFFGATPLHEIIGKSLIYRDSIHVSVTGIIADPEERTDFDFTDFLSISTNEVLSKSMKQFQVTNSSSQFFVKLAAGVRAEDVQKQMSKIEKIYREKNKDTEWSIQPTLQPLSDLHFNTQIGIFDHSRSVSKKSTFEILILVAILLLVIAVINFVNLETAQSSRRFLTESFVLTFVAVLCSLLLTYLCLIWFADFIPPGVELDLTDSTILLFLLISTVTVTLLAGIYPAFVLSSFQPAMALKNIAFSRTSMTRSSFIRKALTIFQFSFAQILILGTIAVGLQINHMLSQDLGFSSEAIIWFYAPFDQPKEKRAALKNELDQMSNIKMISGHNSPPSAPGYSSSVMEFDNGKEILKHDVFHKTADEKYLDLYGIKLLAGREISERDSAKHILINETYMKLLGISQPVDALGKTIDKERVVIGVVRDFNTQSLHSPIKPVIIYNRPGGYWCFGIRFTSEGNSKTDLKDQIASVENVFKKIYPDSEFKYSFVDETIKRFYETEERTAKLTRAATIVAILISCLGLFGLSSFTVIQRTKEIGIRKVLGASVSGILMLLSSDFVKLVLIAFLIAAPIAYYFIDEWLGAYAYRMEITWWLFAIAAMASVLTAFITISFRTVSAAKADPVESLRYE